MSFGIIHSLDFDVVEPADNLLKWANRDLATIIADHLPKVVTGHLKPATNSETEDTSSRSLAGRATENSHSIQIHDLFTSLSSWYSIQTAYLAPSA